MSKAKGQWSVLTVLSMAAFIMVIDSTAMNVSISNLVADLNTDIGTIQMIMSMYTLTMAAFMLPGAKIADIFGKRQIFLIGVSMYGVGTLTAALAVNTAMLFIGWALIEGLASSLMMPTALSLITSAYQGKQRAVAMSVYTAMGSVALAIGPLFGGFITSYFSWRYVFALEVLIVVYILVRFKTILRIDAPAGDKTEKFDIPGTILAVLTMLSIIAGALLSSTYGWFTPKKPFTLFGMTLSGVSITFVLLCAGAVLLALLIAWLVHAKKKNRPVLIDIAVFKSRLYDFVLMINFCVQVCLISTMFVTSLYLQNVLRYDSLHTGFTLIPLSLALFIASLIAVKLTQKVPPRFVVAVGSVSIFAGALYMYLRLSGSDMVTGVQMVPSMLLLGIGIGCTISLTGNIGLSSLDPAYSNQASGMITTVNNFGSSISTSVMGSVFTGSIGGSILASFVSRFPEAFGSMTNEQAAQSLTAAFQKVKLMDTAASDFPADTVTAVSEAVIGGVNSAMQPIFLVVMVMSALAALVSLSFLKAKNK